MRTRSGLRGVTRVDGGTLSDNGKVCPSNMLQCPVQVSLNHWLSRFVVEARRALEDGQPYLPMSVVS